MGNSVLKCPKIHSLSLIMMDCVCIFQDCKRWLRQHSVSTDDEMSFYVDRVRGLLQPSSLQSYNDR